MFQAANRPLTFMEGLTYSVRPSGRFIIYDIKFHGHFINCIWSPHDTQGPNGEKFMASKDLTEIDNIFYHRNLATNNERISWSWFNSLEDAAQHLYFLKFLNRL